MISKDAIKEFQTLYLAEYGKEITYEEAATRAEHLLRLYKCIFKPSASKGTIDESKNHSSTTTQ